MSRCDPNCPRTCAGEDGIYVAGGDSQTLIVSTNCVDWEQRPLPRDLRSLARGRTNWVAIAGGSIIASADLANWTITETPYSFGPVFDSVTYGSGRFVVTGAWGFDEPYASRASVILYSDDSTHWHFAPIGDLDAFGEIRTSTFAAGQFVAVLGRNVLRSSDGVAWTKISAPPGAIWSHRSCWVPDGTICGGGRPRRNPRLRRRTNLERDQRRAE